jgi:UDP-glucose 4-epimerase
LAAKTHVNDPSPALWDEYKRVNIGGTRCIVEAGRAFGARRVVLFSTISVYGPTRPGEIFDEASPLQPQTVYAKTKVEAEQVALSVNNASGEALSVVLRLAAVYGPRIKGNYARLVSSLRRGWFVPVGRGNNRRTLVNVEDVATAALLGAEHEEAGGRVYNVTDGEFHRFKDIIAAISIAQGRRPPHWHLPIGPVKSVVSLLERMYVRAGKQPAVSRDLIDKILEDVAVSGDKIQRDLGFHPQIDLLTGWKQTIQFMESGLPLHLPNAPASIEHTLRKGNRSPGFSTEHINKNQC